MNSMPLDIKGKATSLLSRQKDVIWWDYCKQHVFLFALLRFGFENTVHFSFIFCMPAMWRDVAVLLILYILYNFQSLIQSCVIRMWLGGLTVCAANTLQYCLSPVPLLFPGTIACLSCWL